MKSYWCNDRAFQIVIFKASLAFSLGHSFYFLGSFYQDLVLRFDILRKLDVHRGCVNTVSFNASGDILVSGSDDKRIVLWDWETGQVKLSFHSDHSNNVFQAKFMPYTEDKRIVTCAADGQVISLSLLIIDYLFPWECLTLFSQARCGVIGTNDVGIYLKVWF